ncbi:hypothetical protein JKA74_07330 [Marivirga sp. S37H4]|uniref:LiaF transmembrane domain-containing protein n=1 Tax=Marivirga aurantiaca TaxID=2802615 RepID=A0A934WXB1_9BACT|nr:DUF5668 domain-containing protein [Marivirga aurantiaca]MBK6264843.1 hypothetical protein [Marivirga aurantiaca]
MKKNKQNLSNGNVTAGLILLAIGVFMILKRLDIFDASWLLSWPVILIIIGVFSLVRHRFNNGFGMFMILFGSFLLIKKENLLPMEFEPYLIPGGLIALGIYFILVRGIGSGKDTWSSESWSLGSGKNKFDDDNDFINAEALFAGVQRRMLSQNFKGGKISAIFGGADIDLSKAELEDGAILNVEVIFGGMKLIIPPHWEIKADVSNIFAGVEDKRAFPPTGEASNKVLRIIGSVTFGGLEIKSY